MAVLGEPLRLLICGAAGLALLMQGAAAAGIDAFAAAHQSEELLIKPPRHQELRATRVELLP
jgi:hypothetical protein